jgi:hypothetical protein
MTTSADLPTLPSPSSNTAITNARTAGRDGASHRQPGAQAIRPGPQIRIPTFSMSMVHPNAESDAETAEFAGAIGLFWEMHDALYEN